MDVLPLHFRTLRFFGIWHETENEHWLVKNLWRPFNVTIIVIFTISQLGALMIYRNNVSDFTECLFLSLTYFGLCFKLVNWLYRRNAMNKLLSEFRSKICRLRNDEEQEIIAGYKKIIAMLFNAMLAVALLNNCSFAVIPLISMLAGNRAIFLPFKTYEIYDKENQVYYWATYIFQVVTNIVGTFVNVTFDTMLAGFFLLTCGQIDLCCHRFISTSYLQIKLSTRECIAHQLLVWRIVWKLENFFMRAVVPLMFLSLITFCTSVYNLSKANAGVAESLSFFIYLVCLLGQLYSYCWFGNELKMKSTAISDTMYNSNWTMLRPSDRKVLYFIMFSCRKDMSISFHGLCALTIKIFVWVLKTSYSVYNLLKTAENQ